MKKPTARKRRPSPQRKDPLVDEVRRIRAEISKEHGHDLDRLCEHLREVESQHGGKIVHKRGRPSSV